MALEHQYKEPSLTTKSLQYFALGIRTIRPSEFRGWRF